MLRWTCYFRPCILICLGLCLYSCACCQFVDYTSSSGVTMSSESAMWGNGMSAFDFNEDGFDDLTIAENLSGIALYESQGNGNFNLVQYVALNAVIKHVLWVDFDNDHDADLFVTTNGSGFYLYERQETGELSLRTDLFEEYPQYDAQGASWCDFDKDGWLDLYVCHYQYGQAPNHPNLLFHNFEGEFTEVGTQMGVSSWENQAFQSVWTDFDRDGWPDLYVINDHEVGNEYYRNNAGTGFEEWSQINGAGVSLASMSNSVADFDRDGDFDVFVSNGGYQCLLQNSDGQFENVASNLGISVFTFGWGGVWLDQDNDGWQDLYL
ncbi:MAG: FG-GAP repeat domain-containing protein, partial [Flavobacteriales bacterium]